MCVGVSVRWYEGIPPHQNLLLCHANIEEMQKYSAEISEGSGEDPMPLQLPYHLISRVILVEEGGK